jgi:acetyltransferase-like isoleucine patch superfamily enzyme
LYTIWQAQEFKCCGDNLFISSPINIIGGKFISIKNNVSIGKNSVINAWEKYENETYNPLIIIGNNTLIGDECHISAINKIIIGENVLIGKRVSIIDNSHGNSSTIELLTTPSKRKLSTKGPIIIAENVWIGDKVSILSGVTIGSNSIIGANAVVTKDVPSNSVFGGIPAKLIKTIK